MHQPALKAKAQTLRAQGKTYNEIKHSLHAKLSKSTLSEWCQEVVLPKGYQEKIDKLKQKNLTKAQRYAHAQLWQKRETFLAHVKEKARSTLVKMNQKTLKISLAMLYLGEGAKWKSHSGLMLGNADPHVILLYIALLEKCYGIKPEKLKCRISFRADQDINILEQFWSRVTGISRRNFYKTKPDPRSIGKKTKRLDYKGVCVIMCAGAHIQLELDVLTKLLLEKIMGR